MKKTKSPAAGAPGAKPGKNSQVNVMPKATIQDAPLKVHGDPLEEKPKKAESRGKKKQ